MSKSNILMVVVAVVLIAFIIWAAVAGPCELYKFAANKDVPARCIGEYTR